MTIDNTRKHERATEGALGWFSWSLLAVGIIAVVAYGSAWNKPGKPKRQIPPFELNDQDGEKVGLNTLRGKVPKRQIPPFELNDQDGKKVGLNTLRGKVWIGTFMFTSCRNACPAMAAELLRIQKTIRNDSTLDGRLRLLSFSLDPGIDTQQRLAEYAGQQGIDSSCWSFLRGERAEVVRLCEEGFGLSAGGGTAAAGSVVHSDRFVLVDAEGKIRGYYRPSAVPGDLEKLIAAARDLLLKNSGG